MRLLDTSTLELKEMSERDAQQDGYAILSHRWEDDEVTYDDVGTSRMRTRRSFGKLEACCKVAKEEGLKWAWIDTCCIDKSSSVELSEAINSMFRWYQKASVCYAYLSDVSEESSDVSEESSDEEEKGFGRSEWFTRGWTLQELLAPQEVVFFSRSWTELGTKHTLSTDITYATHIPHDAICMRRPLSTFSIAQRMSWAARRKTSRIEDVAYCLMGIFDINMPLLYGEQDKAFQRLQLEILRQTDDLSILACIQDSLDAYCPSPRKGLGLLATRPALFDVVLEHDSPAERSSDAGKGMGCAASMAWPMAEPGDGLSGSTFETLGDVLKVRGQVALGIVRRAWMYPFGPSNPNVLPNPPQGVQVNEVWSNWVAGSMYGYLRPPNPFSYFSPLSGQPYAPLPAEAMALLLLPNCRTVKSTLGVLLERTAQIPEIWDRTTTGTGLVHIESRRVPELFFQTRAIHIRLRPDNTTEEAHIANMNDGNRFARFLFPGLIESWQSHGYTVNVITPYATRSSATAAVDMTTLHDGDAMPASISRAGWFGQDWHADSVPPLEFQRWWGDDLPFNNRDMCETTIQRLLFKPRGDAAASGRQAPPFVLALSFEEPSAREISKGGPYHPLRIGFAPVRPHQVEMGPWPQPTLQDAPWHFPLHTNENGTACHRMVSVTIRKCPGWKWFLIIRRVEMQARP